MRTVLHPLVSAWERPSCFYDARTMEILRLAVLELALLEEMAGSRIPRAASVWCHSFTGFITVAASLSCSHNALYASDATFSLDDLDASS